MGKNKLPINEDKQVNEAKGKEKQIMNKTESIISRTLSPPLPLPLPLPLIIMGYLANRDGELTNFSASRCNLNVNCNSLYLVTKEYVIKSLL